MDKKTYQALEAHMVACMQDTAHDREHIYRVLSACLDIAGTVPDPVDLDVLVAAALLHDIGRQAQFENPALCHARVGSEMAGEFLLGLGWAAPQANHVAQCILTHRFRSDCPPHSMEAKILFDADKLDVTGAMGIARTLCYGGAIGVALYTRNERGPILEPDGHGDNTFLQEYRHKLEHIDRGLYTQRAKEIAARRAPIARAFYLALVEEISDGHHMEEAFL